MSKTLALDERVASSLSQAQDALGCPLEVLATISTEGIFVVDPDRNVLLYNRRAEELTGISASEVVGRPCVAGFRCPTCFDGCHVFDGEVHAEGLEIFRSDGRTVRVRKAGRVLRSPSGKVVGAVELFSEIEVEARTEVALADVRWSGVDTALSSLGRVALLVDASMRVRRVSKLGREVFGKEAGDVLGCPAADLLGMELLGRDSRFRLAMELGERPEGWRTTLRNPGRRAASYVLSAARAPSELSGEGFLIVLRPERPLALDGPPPAPGVRREALVPEALPSFDGMIGAAPSMQRIFQLIEHLRESDATVLLTGESGTGKELVAQAMHKHSPRAQRPFVAINCAALPSELLETELFGHVRGAFTGAVRDKVGRFEVAADGTLFLDELGDLPLPLQVKLLRVLQERVFERVGDTAPRPFRARVIAATHQDLAALVAERRFREDLYYRLNVVRVHLPPLRERKEDLELLITHLLDRFGRQRHRPLLLSDAALRALLSQDWPGNVRQLENALEYAATVCRGTTIQLSDLPPEVTREPCEVRAPEPRPAAADLTSLSYPSAEQIRSALAQARNRRAEAAKLLGVSRTTLWRRIRELANEEALS